jgi:hypothetical protein
MSGEGRLYRTEDQGVYGQVDSIDADQEVMSPGEPSV